MPLERLQKILARAGIASRRQAEKIILSGRVTVNGTIVRELGTKADAQKDEIRVDGKLIYEEREKLYLMFYKPKGYITSMMDPQGRPTVGHLLGKLGTRVFPVGRLDFHSQGLLLLTNDGDFAQKILHPRFSIPKVYHVKIKGHLSEIELTKLKKGIELEDGPFSPQEVNILKNNRATTWLSITVKEGRNRLIRRAMATLGHDVLELVRVAIGGLELKDLKCGKFRFLSEKEVARVFMGKNLLD